MAKSSGQVPAWVVSGIACLLLSSAGTVAVMLMLDYKQGPTNYEIMQEAKAQQGKGGGGGGGGAPKGPIPGAADKGGPTDEMTKKMNESANAPRPSAQVVALVEKLDVLTVEPGKLELTKDQRAKVAEQLDKLAEPEFLGDIPARDSLSAILRVLENQRKNLEAAGFQWPAENPHPEAAAYAGQKMAGAPVKNPFKEGEAAKRLKALKDRLTSA